MTFAKRIRVHAFILACIASVAAPARADDFLHGMQALETGHTEQAIELWRPLAESGNVEAQFGLGVIYNDGMGVAQDYAEANYWFLRAAEQGMAAAQFNLGNAYKNGTGMKPDPQMAVRWWRKAADQDFGPAQFNLGSALMEGFGTQRDPEAGLQWYRRAAANGHTHAQAFLEELGAPTGDPKTLQRAADDTTPPQKRAKDVRTKNAAAPARGTTAVSPPDATPKTAATAPEPAKPDMTVPEAASRPAPDTAKPQRSAAAAPYEARSTGAPVACADWLDRDANTFTVQLLSSPQPEDAHQYAARHALSDTAICSYQVKGRRWHALLYGRYDSSTTARAALAALPAPVRADGAYVRRIAEIRNAMNTP